MLKFIFPLILIQTFTVPSDFCENRYYSIDKVLKGSKYAAKYFVKSYEMVGYLDQDENYKKYEYVLKLAEDFSDNSPETILVTGGKPIQTLPASYLNIEYYHNKLISENDISWGLATTVTPHRKGECSFYPRFVVEESYNYIILGEIDSPVEAEPIIHRNDPWQKLVKRFFSKRRVD